MTLGENGWVCRRCRRVLKPDQARKVTVRVWGPCGWIRGTHGVCKDKLACAEERKLREKRKIGA